jgi:predicted permease
MFALADAILLRPLPVRAPERLVRIDTYDSDDPRQQSRGVTEPVLTIVRTANVFDGVCGFLTPMVTLDVGGHVTRASGIVASGDCFVTLGVRPAIGRLFGPDDDRGGAPRVAVLSYDAWMSMFSGAPDLLHRTVNVDGAEFAIVGVVQQGFPGLLTGFPAQVYVPLYQIALPSDLSFATLGQTVFARLKDGDRQSAVGAHIQAEWRRWIDASTVPPAVSSERARWRQRVAVVTSGATGIDYVLRGRFGKPLTMLVCLAILVLLVGAVNVANLALARRAAQERDIHIRVALGASRWRIARTVLIESALVLGVAVAIGFCVAYLGDRFLVSLWHANVATFDVDVRPDARIALFAAAVSAVAFVIFAMVPALQFGNDDVRGLPVGAMRSTPGRRGPRRVVLVTQVALTLVLVALGAEFAQALRSLRHVPLGLQVDHVVAVQLSAVKGYPSAGVPPSYYRDLLDHIERIPGVTGLTLSADVPFQTAMRIVDVGSSSGAATATAEEAIVTDRFFETMKIPLLAGEDFRRTDSLRTQRSAIVSESLARRLFGPANPVGMYIRTGNRPELQATRIVGVADDAILSRPQSRNALVVYQNWWQAPIVFPTLLIRAQAEPTAVVTAVRDELRRRGREYPAQVRTIRSTWEASLAQERLLAAISSAFGMLGLLLAGVGLYGLLAFSVASRTAEIGIRVALGATRGRVAQTIVGEAVGLVALGIALGLPIASAAVRVAAHVLFSEAPNTTPMTGWSVALTLTTFLLGAAVPTIRAMSLNPIETLRHD